MSKFVRIMKSMSKVQKMVALGASSVLVCGAVAGGVLWYNHSREEAQAKAEAEQLIADAEEMSAEELSEFLSNNAVDLEVREELEEKSDEKYAEEDETVASKPVEDKQEESKPSEGEKDESSNNNNTSESKPSGGNNNNNSKPVEPTKPVEPSKPQEPSKPTEPTKPVEPPKPSRPSDDAIDVSDIPPAKYMLNGTANTLMKNYAISASYSGNRVNEINDVVASLAKGAIDFNNAKQRLVGKVTDNGTLRIKNVKYKSVDYSMTDPMKTTYQYADEIWKANGFVNYKPSSSVAYDKVFLAHLDQNENMRLYRIIVEFEKI